MLVIEDNLCNNYCNISLNNTYRDFLYKWTSSHIQKRRVERQEKLRENTKNPNPILSSKEAIATLSSFLFFIKKTSNHPTPFKKKTEITLFNDNGLSISPSHRPSKRGPLLTSKSHHIGCHSVLQERPSSFFFFLPSSPTWTSSLCHINNIISVPHGWFPFGRNTTVKLVYVDNSRTPSSAINIISSNGELHP